MFEELISNPLWASVIIAAILAIITAYYAREMKKTRMESIKPNFSLRTGLYTIGGGIHALYLINIGGVAREVKIDVKENDSINKRYYVPSLGLGEEINLEFASDNIKDRTGILEIILTFKDGYYRDLDDILKIDFDAIKKEGREIQLQLVPLNRSLEEISSSLKKIETAIGRIK